MTTFVESPRFPDWIAFWARGGRGFNTTVVRTYGGDEYRNSAWAQGLGEWIWDQTDAAAFSANPLAPYAYTALRNLFAAVMGQQYLFRFKDFRDYQDEGSGVFIMLTATTFQMYKSYVVSPLTYNQIIQKPVSGSVAVTGGVTPVVDYTTGIVTVASGTPTSWTGQFDIPVRFASDLPQAGPDDSGAQINWENLKLAEVRNIT
jgi:uncharacterized protein (TIGR02217 family)